MNQSNKVENNPKQKQTVFIILGGAWITVLFLISILTFATYTDIVSMILIGCLAASIAVILYSISYLIDFEFVTETIVKSSNVRAETKPKAGTKKRTAKRPVSNSQRTHQPVPA